MTDELRVLVIDDSENDAFLIAHELERANRPSLCHRVQDEATVRTALDSHDWDVVLCDSSMPNFGARAAQALLDEKGLEIPLILVSGACDESVAAGVGARDFVRKDQLSRLVPTIERHLPSTREITPSRGELDLSSRDRELLRLREQLREQEPWVALGRSAASIAHDLNNALSVILTRASPFMNEVECGGLWRENREEIETAARRAATFSHRILAFGRGDFCASQLLNVNSFLRELEGTLQCLAGDTVKLVLDASASFSWIRADSRQIERIIVGLVIHARKAMPGGGRLTIATSNALRGDGPLDERDGTAAAQDVVLTVADTGAGMDEVTRARVFEPLFGTHDGGEATNELHTVFDLLRRCRGAIRVESEMGAGTTFFVQLPSIETGGASDRSPAQPGVPLARERETVLLVEEDDHVRASAGLVLRRCGYRVYEAQNAGEALLIGKRAASRIDLLVADLVLPRVGGIELAEELQASRPEMRMLFISGDTEDAMSVDGAGLPFVQKPLTPELLATKVRQELDRTADTIPPP